MNYKKKWEELKKFIEYRKNYYENIEKNKILNNEKRKNAINNRIIILNMILAEMENIESEY